MVAFGNASGYVDTIDVKKDINAKGYFLQDHLLLIILLKEKNLLSQQKKFLMQFYQKKFKFEISKKYSLKDAAQAHKDLEARKLTGPAVIIP